MKKVGIITHYYKTKNYGGALQSYALCKLLNNNEYVAEQICYDFLNEKSVSVKAKNNKRICLLVKFIKLAKKILFKLNVKRRLVMIDYNKNKVQLKQEQSFKNFLENDIPHSVEVYNDKTIYDCVKNYEVFITGSDQVWNLKWYKSAFFLNFVPTNKEKVAYAASIAMPSLNEEEKKIFQNSLKGFKAISLRENCDIDLIKDVAPVEPEHVLDPTLLLNKEDWDNVCFDRMIDEDYIFCYFLGDNCKEREIAKEYAKLKKIKLVTIPYAGSSMKFFNMTYGDVKLYDVSPQKFISLIKHAKYIFTDSYHAVVFSHIYEKQYFVFNRNKKRALNSRIKDITNLFDSQERFCDGENENIEYVNSLSDIDYSYNNSRFKVLKEKSIKFLFQAIGDNDFI